MTRICNPNSQPHQKAARNSWFAPAFILLLLLGCIARVSALPSESNTDSLNTWLTELHLPASVLRSLQARRTVDAQASQWIVQNEQQVYVLAIQPVTTDVHAQIQQAQRGNVEMRARHGLLLYAAGETYQQQGFNNREAIAKALALLDNTTTGQLLTGLQSRSTLLDTSIAALVWIAEDRIIAYRHKPPPLTRFLPAYCEALYPTAKAVFEEGRHSQALALYQEMYALQCQQPLAYFLDAADCFAALNQPQDARRMVNHLLNDTKLLLSSGIVERAGDLLLKTGNEKEANRAYEQALKLMQ